MSADSPSPGPFVLPVDEHSKRGDMKILAPDWDVLLEHLLDDGDEHAALLLCGQQETADSVTFLVRELVLLTAADYLDRGALHLSIAPTTLARAAKRARLLDASVIMVHSHPFPGRVVASKIDLRTEADLCRRVLPARTGRAVAALVVGPDGVDGRLWTGVGAGPFDEIRVLGEAITKIPVSSHGIPTHLQGRGRWSDAAAPTSHDGSEHADEDESPTARQELLWGRDGQAALRRAHVVVVGAGGTGSHVITQLAHLRIGRLTLIDDDDVEVSNLSRIIGLGPGDVGRSKVAALAEQIRRINPECIIETIQASVLDIDPRLLTAGDVIVCATDGHGSRSLLTEIAVQYFVPVVDLGVEVVPGDSFRAGGGVRVLRPGSGCLWCAQTLSPALVREEYLSDAERSIEAQRGYLRGYTVAAPSVVALNGVVGSLAVMEICQLLVGMLGSGRDRLLYRSEQRALSTAALRSRPDCHVCGHAGVRGQGDAARVKTRWRKLPARGA
jgi:molybdopterin-synthase adenylyltransferase